MSITSQPVSRECISNRAVAARRASVNGVPDNYSTTTDLPNFAGYTIAPAGEVHPKRNPIAEFLSDDVYELLRDYDLINEKALRDFLIRRDYRKVRKELHMSRADAIDFLQTHYPYLQVDTIRKIVYHVSSNPERKRML